MIPEPDFRTIVQDLSALTREWTLRTQKMQEALASGGGIHECPEFTLRMTGTCQISELRLTAEAQRLSAAALRGKILKAHADLVSSANAATSQYVATIMEAPEAARGIRSSLPIEVADLTTVEAPELAETAARVRQKPPATTDPEVDEILEWVDQTLGSAAELDLDELFADIPEWDPAHPIDPDNAQHDFEKEIARITENGAGLAADLAKIVAKVSSRTVDMVVNGSGRLIDIAFHLPFSRANLEDLNRDVRVVHAQACEEASQRATERLAESSPGPDDPTSSLFSGVAEDAREILATEETDTPRRHHRR